MGAELNRRQFLGATGAAATGLALGVTSPASARPNDRVAIGCIGVGSRGSTLLQRLLNRPDVEIVVINDIDEGNLNRAVETVEKTRGKTPESTDGDEDFKKLADRKDLDALVIAVPCDLHAGMYLACLQGNKSFYGEKPMCLTVAECEELLSVARKSKAIAQIGFQRRLSSRYQEGIKRIHGGELGELIEARGSWLNSWGPHGVGTWFGRVERSGDWMLEQACHTFDVMNWVAGELPLRAYGKGKREMFVDVDPDRNTTEYYSAVVEYPQFTFSFLHNWCCPKNDKDHVFDGVHERVVGTQGAIELGSGKVMWRDPQRAADVIAESASDLTQLSVNSFLDCLRDGTKPVSGLANGYAATVVGILVRTAVYREEVVTMEQILKGA